MASISRPVYYLMVGSVLAAVAWNLMPSDDAPVRKSKPTKRTNKQSEDDSKYVAAEMAMKFERPTSPVRNVFHPLVVVEKPEKTAAPPPPADQDLKAIPAKIADGESNWVFTGMAEVDGTKVALLQNNSTKQSGLLKEGEYWRKSQLISISLDSILFVGHDGNIQTVFRFDPNAPPKVKTPTESGFRPYDLSGPLAGPIGTQVQIRRISADDHRGQKSSPATSTSIPAKKQ